MQPKAVLNLNFENWHRHNNASLRFHFPIRLITRSFSWVIKLREKIRVKIVGFVLRIERYDMKQVLLSNGSEQNMVPRGCCRTTGLFSNSALWKCLAPQTCTISSANRNCYHRGVWSLNSLWPQDRQGSFNGETNSASFIHPSLLPNHKDITLGHPTLHSPLKNPEVTLPHHPPTRPCISLHLNHSQNRSTRKSCQKP